MVNTVIISFSPIIIIAILATSWIPPADSVTCALRPEQSVAVKGQLTCHGKPAGDILVKLWEKDLVKDDFMAKGNTDKRGHFRLSGSSCEISTIEPQLNIYHRCENAGFKICTRKLSIMIPKSYVTKGKHPSKVYDMGKHELSGRVSGEGSDCIH